MSNSLPLPEVFNFEGRTVRWGRIGNQGSAVVMVHGTPFSSYVWRRIAPLLAQHHQVFYYDLLGYGQSEKAEGQDVSLGVQNNVLAALLEHWGLEQPQVVAHDFGGATALRTYLLNHVAYASLTLIDPVAIAPWGSPLIQHVRHHEQAFSGAPAYVHEAIINAYIQGAVFRPLHAEDLQAYVTPWTGDIGQAAFYRQIAQMDQAFTDEIEHRFNEIKCPVMLLWGEEDRWIPIEQGDELARRIPGVKYIRVPAAGHLVQEEAPEVIVAHVLNFLRA
ncbi:alpha/beta fold hydrolase [Pseudomonas costantinii]|uniref:Alpha/beta hydrolase n=1 Tax=Pseudomonas costantinii TaxID=168469 RepID=A0A1S2V7B3_9PSED|nr:alpha/beta hydrolase [Pseudomonas costantinii]OIN53888.1 alpha/beta hydrolase [Pseudomonas costantinii]SED30053.1 Pimeloyl-ACP methyl ester carboxylesterase [Pseudomonas costantinii]